MRACPRQLLSRSILPQARHSCRVSRKRGGERENSFCSVPRENKNNEQMIEREIKLPPAKENRLSTIPIVGVSSFLLMSSLIHLHTNVFGADGSVLLGSFGASCFLLCFSPEALIAQPRNVIGGHCLGAGCGVISHFVADFLQPVSDVGVQSLVSGSAAMDVSETIVPLISAGPVAVSTAAMIMMLTKTIHFPAGGTALGVALSPSIVPDVTQGVGPEVMMLMTEVCFSSSALVSMACILHRGSYPNLK